MRIETMLHTEIENEFEELKRIQLGTDEYKTTVDGLTKLVDKAIEIRKFDIEQDEKRKIREDENAFKIQQMEDDKKDRRMKNCIAIGGIGIPAALTIWGTLKSLKFEETGTVTTLIGRGFINKLLKK